MYHQILVTPSDSNLQGIEWCDAPHRELQHYALRTVTYGTASASFLATRTLKQLTVDERREFPAASNVIMEDFYVNDVLTGASSFQELCKQLQKDLINLE